MSNPTPAPSSQPSSTPAAPTTPITAQPQAGKHVDPKTQVKAVVESIKTGEPTASTPKKFKVKVDNQEREVDEAELINNYQLRQLSDKKRSEAEKTMAEYQKLFTHLKNDPIKFMQATGIDFDKLSTSYLARKAEDAMLDPRDRELREAKAKAEQYEKWVNEQKSNQEKAAKEASIASERSKLHSEIIEAIEQAKDLGMPIDEELVIAVAQKMILQDKKQKPLNAKEALPKAYASTQKWMQGMASKMEGESLVKWLGPDVASKIRKYDLAQLKAKRLAAAQQPSAAVKPQEQKGLPTAKPYKTWSEFKKERLDTIQ